MDVRKLYQDGVSISAMARQLGRDRKTVRKYLEEAPQPYRRGQREWKVDGHRAWLRERAASGYALRRTLTASSQNINPIPN